MRISPSHSFYFVFFTDHLIPFCCFLFCAQVTGELRPLSSSLLQIYSSFLCFRCRERAPPRASARAFRAGHCVRSIRSDSISPVFSSYLVDWLVSGRFRLSLSTQVLLCGLRSDWFRLLWIHRGTCCHSSCRALLSSHLRRSYLFLFCRFLLSIPACCLGRGARPVAITMVSFEMNDRKSPWDLFLPLFILFPVTAAKSFVSLSSIRPIISVS